MHRHQLVEGEEENDFVAPILWVVKRLLEVGLPDGQNPHVAQHEPHCQEGRQHVASEAAAPGHHAVVEVVVVLGNVIAGAGEVSRFLLLPQDDDDLNGPKGPAH